MILIAGLLAGGQAIAGQFAAGARVEGHFGSEWRPCVVVGEQLPTGGYKLDCPSLPDRDNVFSESDVRTVGAMVRRVAPAPAAAQGRPVQGRFGSNWIDCTQLGGQLPTGGYRLHCDSLPDPENVFSATDVRAIGAAGPTPMAVVVPAPPGRRVQGRVAGVWEGCSMAGAQLPTGGYLLRCDSHPEVESVFSATDVRF